MSRCLVAGNWKMFGSKASVAELLQGIKAGLGQIDCQLAVFPPYVYLQQVAEILTGTAVGWGAQNVSANEPGAYTGEVAAQMLTDFACQYVIVGHSERRALYHEHPIRTQLK